MEVVNTNRWLVAAVIVLAIALFAESLYLVKQHTTQARPGNAPYKVVSQGASPQLTVTTGPVTPRKQPVRYTHRNDPFFSNEPDSWDPFDEMDQIQDMMNRMFRDSLSRAPLGSLAARQNAFFEPDLDVQQTADAYIYRLDLPGVEKDKINVKIQNGMLSISGERKTESEQTEQEGGFYRMESSFGSFMRSFPIPADADANGLTAESKNGVLTIRLPKLKTPAPAKNIQVQ